MGDIRAVELPGAPDEAPLSRFHRRAVLVSGMAFFTDAYDLFVIGIVSTLLKEQWRHARPWRGGVGDAAAGKRSGAGGQPGVAPS